MDPLVSICIPAYNAERFIRQTLESALSQTYPNIEVVVSDDCSKDKTVQIVEEYLPSGVRCIRADQNQGMFKNFNVVIRASTGKYILKLDADDLIDPSHVAEQVRVMEENPEVVFAHCACRLIDVDGKQIGYERSIHGSFIRSGFQEWPRYVFGPRAVNIVMIRRSAYDQVGGYDERYAYSGDWAMHRSLLKIGSVFYNDHVIASYRVHGVGKAGIKLVQAKEHLMHLTDMENEWPTQVPNKEVLLKKAKRTWGFAAASSAAYCEKELQNQILDLVPKFNDDNLLWLYAEFIRLGGGFLIRPYSSLKFSIRQSVKKVFYKKPKNLIGLYMGF